MRNIDGTKLRFPPAGEEPYMVEVRGSRWQVVESHWDGDTFVVDKAEKVDD